MPEIPDVIPGEPIESNWGNDVRDRSIQRYNDATARDSLVPFPQEGEPSWLDDPGVVEVYDGDDWVTIALEDLVVLKTGSTMTGDLTLPELIATTRIQGPTELEYFDVSGILGVSTSEQTIDTFTVPRTGRWLMHVVAQGNYAALTNADLFSMRIRQATVGVALTQVNLFRDWGAPGITTGLFNTTILYRTGFVGAGTEFNVTVARFGTDGGVNLTDLDRSAFNVEQ